MHPLLSGLRVQHQRHPSGPLAPWHHLMQPIPVNRRMNPAKSSQLQQQQQQQPQQIRPMNHPNSGARSSRLEPAASQSPSTSSSPGFSGHNDCKPRVEEGSLAWSNATAIPGKTSFALVQNPSLSLYSFGSQEASQAHTNFPQMSNSGQFTAAQMRSSQGGPSSDPSPLQQPHLTNESLLPHPPPSSRNPLHPPQ